MLSFTCSVSTFKNPGPELAAVAALTTLKQLEMTKCKLPAWSAFGQLGLPDQAQQAQTERAVADG